MDKYNKDKHIRDEGRLVILPLVAALLDAPVLFLQRMQVLLQLDVPDPRTTGVILLGRGSSDRLANGDVARMARWLWENKFPSADE